LPKSYAATLQEIKNHLRHARIRAVLAANPIVIEAYWQTGQIILARQQEAAWGARVIDRLAADLKEAFPDMNGLSPRNLLAMKVFAREFPDGPIAQQAVAQLPWGHVLQIMQRVKDPAARDYYIREAITHGWSRSILEMNIQRQLHLRAGKAQNNFAITMPPADSAHWLTSLKSRISSARQCQNGLIGQQPADQLPKRQLVQGTLAPIGWHGESSNLEYMRKFFLIYRDRLPDKSQMPSGKSQPAPLHKSQMSSGVLPEAAPFVQRSVAQTPFRLSWSQYVFLIPARRAKHRHMLRMGYDL
jgi:predicted nuclease of restriction endonuclease-like (RecB) superfamily